MASLEHLEPLDAWFLSAENRLDHQHIAAVVICEGPPPSLDAVRDSLSARLHRVPRFRQRLQSVPASLARPVWVDCPEIDLDYHVRRTAVPAPGDRPALCELVGLLLSNELDRTRPLWESWLVEGLMGDRWALIMKAHHAMVDGVAGVEVMAAVLDVEPQPAPEQPPPWTPLPVPSSSTLVADAALRMARQPVASAAAVGRALRHPARTLRRGASIARGVADLVSVVRPTDTHGLTGRVGPHRQWTWSEASLEDVMAIREQLGGTVNDILLAAITAGYRTFLLSRGQAIGDGDQLRTVVPVSVRDPSDPATHANRVSVMLVDLPIGQSDPLARLRRVQEQTRHHKATGEAAGGLALLGLLDAFPDPLVEAGTRAAATVLQTLVQRNVASVTTNVPGPPVPLYVMGRRVETLVPYVLVGEGLTTGVAMFSYDGHVTFGVTGDLDASPDVAVLAEGIAAGVDQLIACLQAGPPLMSPATPRGSQPQHESVRDD